MEKNNIPYCEDEDAFEDVVNKSMENVELSKLDWDSFETSWDFNRHPLLPPRGELASNPEKKEETKKIVEEDVSSGNYTDEELRFAVFCIENLAEHLGVDASLVHDALTKESDIMDQYIIPCYNVLHTQGKEYIIEDLLDVMKERGVTI